MAQTSIQATQTHEEGEIFLEKEKRAVSTHHLNEDLQNNKKENLVGLSFHCS